MAENLFARIIEHELGIAAPDRDFSISSPFRSDSNPSFRVYCPKDEENDYGSAYDFGTGEAYTPVSFIMKYKDLSYSEALDYIKNVYGVALSKYDIKRENDVRDLVKLIINFGLCPDPIVVEHLLTSLKKNNKIRNSFVNTYLPSPIYI